MSKQAQWTEPAGRFFKILFYFAVIVFVLMAVVVFIGAL